MKNTCPKCDTAYNVSAAAVGRKFTCKSCGTPVVVTPDGLDYQSAPPPVPAAPAGDNAFDFDAGDDRPARPARKPGRPARPRADDERPEEAPRKPKPRRREVADEPADDFDELPGRKAKRPAGDGTSKVKDFILFREFIAPLFVKLLFVLAVFGILLGGFGVFVAAVLSSKIEFMLGAVAYLIIAVPLNLLVARILCELVLLGFAAYDRLGEIKSLLEKVQAVTPTGPPAPPGEATVLSPAPPAP